MKLVDSKEMPRQTHKMHNANQSHQAGAPSSGAPSSRIERVLEALLPQSSKAARIEERSQARVLVGFTLILIAVSLPVISIQGLRGTPAGMMGGFVLGLTHFAILIAIRRGFSIRVLAELTTLSVFVFGVGIVIASGAKAHASVLVTCLIPLLSSVLLANPPSARRWTLATLAGIGVTAVFTSVTSEFPYSGKIVAWDNARIPALAIAVLTVYATTFIIDRARLMAIKEAENSQRQLETQEASYRAIVENMGDTLIHFDEAARAKYVSPNCVDVLGRPRDQLLGHNYQSVIHPDELQEIELLRRSLQSAPGETRTITIQIRHQNGNWLHCQISIRCYQKSGEKFHFVAIARDVTSIRLAEVTARHNARLKSAGTLSAGIAHQINNPIGSILNASEFALICLDDDDIDGARKALDQNIEQAKRCGNIVRSLLKFAAPGSSSKSSEDLIELIRRARTFTNSYADERSVSIVLAGRLAPLWTHACPIEIEQVLVNVIRNAIESRPQSKQITIAVSERASIARIEVRDDGCGIADADRAQIFDPFYTTRIREGGSGLGLSIAHGIIRDHDGSLEIESSEGKGTCVRIDLPILSSLGGRTPAPFV